MSSVARLIAAVQHTTGITDAALARKLRVAVDVLRAARDGAVPLPRAAGERLEAFSTAIRHGDGSPPEAPPRPPGTPVVELVEGDAVAALRQLPDAAVDMILSDIPYGIGHDAWDVLHDNGNRAYLGTSAAQEAAGSVFRRRRKPINGWSASDRAIPSQYQDFCATFAGEWARVVKPGGSVVAFAGRRLSPRLIVALEDAGLLLRDQLAWLRPGAVFRAQRLATVLRKRGDLAAAERWEGWRVGNLRPAFEPIVWAFRPYPATVVDNVLERGLGAFDLTRWRHATGASDNVFEVGFAPGEAGLHEAQKPEALLRALVELCTPPGALVLDTFAGSGSTGAAAVATGRRALLVERDPSHCRQIRRRLASSLA